MSVQQKVVFTTPPDINSAEALDRISELMPEPVNDHLEQSRIDLKRSTRITATDNTFTIETTWTDVEAKDTYKELMADVSPIVKETLANEGWSWEFTPETEDL